MGDRGLKGFLVSLRDTGYSNSISRVFLNFSRRRVSVDCPLLSGLVVSALDFRAAGQLFKFYSGSASRKIT